MSDSENSSNTTCNNELPIFRYRTEIVNKIRNNSVIIINGSTGSGKTTQVPQFILDDALSRKEKCKIIVSQPRKIAAMTIAKRVSIERKCQLGSLVGYQVGLDKKLDKTNFTTNILFCTTGVILQKIIHEQGIGQYTHIILDEIHERDIDTDLLITIIRNHLLETTCDAKIILMSATINTDRFVSYFTLSVNSKEYLTLEQQKQRILTEKHPIKIMICEPKVIKIETDAKETKYKVDIKYLNELTAINFGLSSFDFKCPSTTVEMFSLAAKIVVLYLRENGDKSILIFLPGIYEIESAYAILANCGELKEKCMLYVLHSSLPASEQKEIFRPSSLPKVILSTNIAESSVTLPNVGCVIDFCLTKCIVGGCESSLTSLKLEWATKHSCMQRAGRTGRTCNGKVYRLVDKCHYDYFIEETISEMTRAPLETVVLRVKQINNDPPHDFLNRTMNPPNRKNIFNSVMILKELGGLTMLCRDGEFNTIDGDLSFIGQIMALLPIDVRLAKLISLGWLFSVMSETIIIAAGLSVKNLFKNHFDKKMHDYKQKLYWANGSCCDSIAILNAYRFWQHAVERGDFQNWEDELKFCDKYNFERKALHEMRNLIHEIENRLGDLLLEGNSIWNQRETHFVIKLCMAGAFLPNYYMQRETEEIDERSASKILCSLDPYQTVYFRKMDFSRIGDLYAEQIKDKLISEGIVETGTNIDITFDSSKILVQFTNPKALIDDEHYNCDETVIQKRTIFPGVIPQEVYMSIFFRKNVMHRCRIEKKRYGLRQTLDSSMELHVFNSKYQEEEYAAEQGLGEMVNGNFHLKLRYIGSPEKCILPSFTTEIIEGIVTHIEHCNKFFFQPQDGSEIYLEELETKLTFEKFTNVDNPQKGMLVIVFHQEKYMRARIEMVIESNEVVDCFMIDYGYTVECPFPEVMMMSNDKMENYFSLSERCLECTLTGIFPSYIKCPRGKWTSKSIHLFKEKVLKQKCKISVYSVVGDKVSVTLYVDGININDFMVEQNYARNGQESYMSRINHNERENIQSSSDNWITRDIEFKTKVNKLLKKTIKAPPLNECARVIHLEGPFSPLETTISELTLHRNGVVSVNPQSVNHITLNDSLEKGNHGKLLIAADVLTNSSGDSISLYNVTVMPNVNGLPAIISMIFAPSVTFYRDDDQNIVKMRFGVGCDSKYNEAIFYEHDCILPINFDIINDDIQNINELRSCMSQLYNEAFSIKDFEKKECKHEIKNLISKIFGKERPIIRRKANMSAIIDEKWPPNDKNFLVISRSSFEKPYIPKSI